MLELLLWDESPPTERRCRSIEAHLLQEFSITSRMVRALLQLGQVVRMNESSFEDEAVESV